MSRKDGFLALLVVVAWGLNFVVIKVGLHHMPPLLLAGLRFLLVAFPAIFLIDILRFSKSIDGGFLGGLHKIPGGR